MYKRSLALLAPVAIVSCVTVNIYFPAAAAEKAADQIILDVWHQQGDSAKPATATPPAKSGAKKPNKARLTRAASSSRHSAPSAAKRTHKTWTSTPHPRKSNKSRHAWRAALANCTPSSIAAPSA